jgi:4-amino-4-deoxy-L-arabinose transferase-like glycosyltransferase
MSVLSAARPPLPAGRREMRAAVVLAACLALALALRLPWLGVKLGIDEGGVAWIAQQWGSGHGSLYGAYWLDRPPLLVALYKAALLGGDLGIRLLGAAAAVGIVATVALIARSLAGPRAAAVAGLFAALFTGSVALAAVFTPAELLAAFPAALSIACLVAVHRGRDARWLAAAGALAVAAALVKQSFLDAGFAGLVFVIASVAEDRRRLRTWPAAYVAGAAVPVAAVAIWQAAAGLPAGSLIYALFGFRLEALGTLAGSTTPLQVRLVRLLPAAVFSGLIVALPVAALGFWRLRGDRVLTATMVAWLAAGVACVLAGGSYWAHYLIQIVPVTCIAAGIAVATAGRRLRIVAVAAVTAVSLVASAYSATNVSGIAPRKSIVDVGSYVRTHARPGDTLYVMYARASVYYYAGLPSPYPYAWSLIVRSVPGAIPRLQRLLASPRRPTWIVGWQWTTTWNLDPTGRTTQLLHTYYRLVTTVDHRRIYLRRDASAAHRA